MPLRCDDDDEVDESELLPYDEGTGTPTQQRESLINAHEAVSERRRALGW